MLPIMFSPFDVTTVHIAWWMVDGGALFNVESFGRYKGSSWLERSHLQDGRNRYYIEDIQLVFIQKFLEQKSHKLPIE